MVKTFLKMNNNNNQLSLGNFCKIIKLNSKNKHLANQGEIFCSLFNIDDINESTINNYCIGARSIGKEYKNKYINLNKDKSELNRIITNLTATLDGTVYIDNLSVNNINKNIRLQKTCISLYSISKNDNTVPKNFTSKLKNYINSSNYYNCIIDIIFYIILEKKQPIYINEIIEENIENILYNTNISIDNLEQFLKLQFNDGINYIYSLKKLASTNNPYAQVELGLMEYTGEISGYPRYNKCYEYLLPAAKSNHPRANYIIGKMLLENKIGEKNTEEALYYLNKAVDLKNIAALNILGLYYLNNSNKELGIKYLEKAAKNKYVYSYNNLGKIYEEKKEYETAFSYYKKSADLEESWACNKIGEMYRNGIGTKKDINLALTYYNKALDVPIKLVNNWAKYNLAIHFYLNGNYKANIEKDPNTAISLLKDIAPKIIEASIKLISIYTEKYLNTLDEKYKNEVYKYIKITEQNPNFNTKYKKLIENNINSLKRKEPISINL